MARHPMVNPLTILALVSGCLLVDQPIDNFSWKDVGKTWVIHGIVTQSDTVPAQSRDTRDLPNCPPPPTLPPADPCAYRPVFLILDLLEGRPRYTMSLTRSSETNHVPITQGFVERSADSLIFLRAHSGVDFGPRRFAVEVYSKRLILRERYRMSAGLARGMGFSVPEIVYDLPVREEWELRTCLDPGPICRGL